VYDSGKGYSYIANISVGASSNIGVVATQNNGRIIHIATPSIAMNSMLIRDSLRWVLFSDSPQSGVKITDKKAIFAIRVDADNSYNVAETQLAIENFRNVTEAKQIAGSWYIVTNHSGTSPVNWSGLQGDYNGLLSAGHEISSHSVTHPNDMNSLTTSQMDYEFQKSKQTIEFNLGVIVRGFANPGNADWKTSLYQRADIANYSYYGHLYQDNVKGVGFIDKTLKILGIQNNLKSDYYWIDYIGKNDTETVDEWKTEFDSLYSNEDGIVINPMWHDYYLDEKKEMYTSFIDYVSGKNIEGISCANVTARVNDWVGYDFESKTTTNSVNVTRKISATKYGQVVFPKGMCLTSISGASSYNNDNKTISFEFSDNSVIVNYNSC
jgi:peptidoglycan/xylan/chitin deacetylase (PgdA/CDA1 family)